jgi:ATP-dependent DNA helicase RecG
LRTDERDYPEEAVCEALLNAIVHAVMFGALQPRNEKLANLFYRMKLIEAYGTGISKIISSYKGLSVQPKFENVEGTFSNE